MTEKNRKNNNSWHERLSHAGVLRILRRNVLLQASLAIITVVLTIVLIFSLTVAWYTNVVQTGGLSFEAEKWNFDGKIELLTEQQISATPGGEGIIPLRVTNQGDHIVAASATVNKNGMEEEMRKRLYFYVDTQVNRNSETVERAYISGLSSYTYTIYPHSELLLSDTRQNAPLIKWMWVYDVLGYYVWGQNEDGVIKPSDYIRPVEYAYDPTTTTFDSEGNLLTVDGQKSVATFVAELTKADGYKGALNLDDPTSPDYVTAVGGYYPISVNSDGYGVWLHLCTEDEIQTNMAYDTAIGSESNTKTYTATVTVTGQNSRGDARPVTSVQELQEALTDPTAGVIQLQENLELTQPLQMAGGTAAIDLNGKTLSVDASIEKIVTLTSGAKLSVENGTIRGAGETDAHAAVTMGGAHLIMNRVTLENVGTGIRIEDNNATDDTASTVYLTECTLLTKQQALWVYGNVDGQKTRTRIVVEDSTLDGAGYAGILCSGNYGGIDMMVSDSDVSGYYTAIYHPQGDSTLTVSNQSTLTGGTGLVVKGGTVTVTDSTVHGTMEDVSDPAYSGSGWTDTGDGIYLEANYAANNADWTVSVTVTNSTVTSDFSQAVRKFDANVENATIKVQSGTFTSYARAETLPDGFINATTNIKEYLADGDNATVNAENDRTCTVTSTTVTN